MKSLDRQVPPAGTPRHRLRRIGFPKNRLQHLPHLARRDAAQTSLPHQLVHRLLTPLVAAQQLARTAAPRARHPQAAHQPQPRPQVSPVVSVAIIAPPRFVPHVAPHPQPIRPLRLQGFLQQPLHFPPHLLAQFFFKESFSLLPAQLKMSSVEDFQFSHRGCTSFVSFTAPEKVHPLSISNLNLHRRSYATPGQTLRSAAVSSFPGVSFAPRESAAGNSQGSRSSVRTIGPPWT